MNVSMKQILCATQFLILFVSAAVYAQPTDIRHADGSPLSSPYCHYDENIQIEGVPAGGTFSGCGVFQQGGDWFFNPAVVAGGSSSMASCSLTYTTGGGSISRNLFVYHDMGIYMSNDAVVCGDTFFLYGNSRVVGAYELNWTGPGTILTPDSYGTYVVLPVGSRGTYVFHAKNLYTGCEASDSVVIETRERLDFRFTGGDTIYTTAGLPALLETRANRGYRITRWSPADLFPDQTALQQSVVIDSPVRITATAVSEDDSCADVSRIQVMVWPAGISQEVVFGQMEIYPNPAVQAIHVRNPETGVVQIRDLSGRTILQYHTTEKHTALDIRSLSPGIYLVCLTDRKGEVLSVRRLVKM